MVMEDLAARGADPRDSLRPLTIEHARSGVRALGRMHGRYWGRRVLQNPDLGWLEPFLPFDGLQYAPLPSALERLDSDTPREVMSLSIDHLVESVWKPYIRTLTKSPQTLLHGDPHIGNTYVTPNNEVGFLDWQMARRGNWSLDLRYFLQGALTMRLHCPQTRCHHPMKSGHATVHRSHTDSRCGCARPAPAAGCGSESKSLSHLPSDMPTPMATSTHALQFTKSPAAQPTSRL
jgi:hypothetical protein